MCVITLVLSSARVKGIRKHFDAIISADRTLLRFLPGLYKYIDLKININIS